MNQLFRRIATQMSRAMGSPVSFLLALLVILIWALLGWRDGFTDTWQLIINTATTIITFLMVFLIQNTQNRDSKAIHLKLDELIKAIKGARQGFVDIEDASDGELERLAQDFQNIHQKNYRIIEKELNRRQNTKLSKEKPTTK